MKNLMRIMIFLSIILITFFYFDSSINENDILEAPRKADPLPAEQIIEKPLEVERPAEGVSVYIAGPPRTGSMITANPHASNLQHSDMNGGFIISPIPIIRWSA